MNFTIKELPRILFYYAGYFQRSMEHRQIRRGRVKSTNARRLLSLKDKHVGQRCFIIGNGPSLTVSDLDHLEKEITFAANKIYLAFDQTDWRPTYYSVEDSLVIRQNYQRINQLNGFTKLFPSRIRRWVPAFDDAIYFNFKLKQFYPGRPQFGPNALGTVFWGSTIVYTCIQLAWYMGIRQIYLIGVDFDFQIPEKTDPANKAILISKGEVNHFHTDYRQPGEKWFEPNLHHQKQAFMAAHEATTAMGGQIYNATRGGKLNIFERIDFDTLVSP